ncbi:unnamed protein product [Brassica oleracea var. botrytis]
MNTDLFGQGEGGDESPISGLNFLAEESTCRMLTVWSHPESYVLQPEEQGGKASPTNFEDYKTPPEDDLMTESRTPDVGNSNLSRYLTRSLKKAELEGKCIPISSTKKDDLQTKRIPRRSTKIGGQSWRKRSFKSFSQFSARNRHIKLEFEIVIGIHVSNKFFLSLARPTNWVSTEHIYVLISMLVRRHGRNYLSRRCRFVDYFSIAGIISKFAEFEKASDKLGFNWGGLVSFSFTGKTPRRNDKKVLLVDVDRVYAPMMWGKDHWVGLVINLTCRQVEILDCNIPLNESDNEVNKHMAYLLRALPHVLAAFSPPSDSSHPEEDQAFSWVRPDNIYFNERSGDYGPCAVKFLEMHAAGYSYEDMGQIDDKKMVGADSFYYLGGILRAGKRGNALVQEPSVLRKCNVQPMVTFATCQICTSGQFQEFFIKCVTAGNTNAIYYEGLYAALIVAVGIFNVCIGNDKEASKLFFSSSKLITMTFARMR